MSSVTTKSLTHMPELKRQSVSVSVWCNFFIFCSLHRPDVTVMVEWASKTKYLSFGWYYAMVTPPWHGRSPGTVEELQRETVKHAHPLMSFWLVCIQGSLLLLLIPFLSPLTLKGSPRAGLEFAYNAFPS